MSEDSHSPHDYTTDIPTDTAETNTFPGLAGYRRMKTHFPSARVKKILQSDEDVGKVAQATPLVVGRAVELFMCSLVEKSLAESANSHTKKISVQMLKKVIDDNDEFDFVADVCDKYLENKDNTNNNKDNNTNNNNA